jgi:predicted kinase
MHDTTIPKAALIVVTGQPGSGKTTLAVPLSQAIRCPRISRDEIKEGLINTTGQCGARGDDIARRAYEIFFDTVELFLHRGVTLIAEAAFQHKLWAPRLQPLCEIARVRIIVCLVTPELARSRRLERSQEDPARLQFHPDPMAWLEQYDPPHLDVPTMMVDTSSGCVPSFEQIVAFTTNGCDQPPPH